MINIFTLFMLMFGLVFLGTGCATVNEGLDKTAEGTRQVSKPVGKIMNIPQAISEGATDGIVDDTNKENPYNR
jgi:hypothetical protein